MKLLYCRVCSDAFALRSFLRRCQCGRSTGIVTRTGYEITGNCSLLAVAYDDLALDVLETKGYKFEGHVEK
jgi:hypothetical protein